MKDSEESVFLNGEWICEADLKNVLSKKGVSEIEIKSLLDAVRDGENHKLTLAYESVGRDILPLTTIIREMIALEKIKDFLR